MDNVKILKGLFCTTCLYSLLDHEFMRNTVHPFCRMSKQVPFKDITNTRPRCPPRNNKRKLDFTVGDCCFNFVPHFLVHD
jgi:hypothetical protein